MAKIDKVLGSISPLYGLASGQGAFAHLRKISPLMHMIGETDTKAEKRRKAEKAAAGGAETPEAGEGMRKGGKVKKMAKGGKLPDLTGDGKITRADVLKGRGVKGFAKGGKVTRGDGIAKKGHTKGRMV